MEIFGFIVFEILFTGIGWVCLHAWYRDRKKVKKILEKEYAGEYSAVARILLLNFIAGLGAIALLGVLIFWLIFWIYRAITG